MELLAPAGTMKNFMAALEEKADAIFLGGKFFNARAQAGNFDEAELREAVKRAHLLGVAVHVTVNIVIADQEMEELEDYIRLLVDIGVDALIVQDLGVASVIQKIAPHIPLHGSTQMSVTNLASVEVLGKLGFTRVVLGREVSLDEIRYICAHTDVEIETFIHGALCICYSGQCYMSSFIGGRSGNRGSCAQPCRKPYELINSNGESVLSKQEAYVLSPKDLNSGKYIAELLEAGVASFKIEGRMKQVSYVKSVVGTYRNIIDKKGKATLEDLKILEDGFNRGFSQAYLENRAGKEMMTIAAPNNQGKYIGVAQGKESYIELHSSFSLEEGDLLKFITDKNDVIYFTVSNAWDVRIKEQEYIYCIPAEGNYQARAYKVGSSKEENRKFSLQDFSRKIPIYAYLNGNVGEPVSLTLLLESGDSVTVYDDYELALAMQHPTNIEKITEQLNRLGNTMFRLIEVYAPEGEYMWPSSVLNNLRRRAIAELEQKMLKDYAEKVVKRPNREDLPLLGKLEYPDKPMISVRVDEFFQVKAAIEAGADKIIFGGERFSRQPYAENIYKMVVDYCREHGVFVSFAMPRIIRELEVETYLPTLRAMIAANPHSISIHFIGARKWLEESGYTGAFEMDTGFNVFNGEAASFCENFGASSIALSPEANLQQIRRIATSSRLPLECLVQGLLEMMISEYCVIGSFLGNGTKQDCPKPCLKDSYQLRDTQGVEFPLRTDPYCRMHILNSKELDMSPYIKELKVAGIRLFRIDARSQESAYIKEKVRLYKALLNGETIELVKEQTGITRGHYFKGIF